jgi:multisubunit Na+/H+ antiporter MnhB subunit
MVAVALVLGAVICVLGLMFNMFSAWLFIQNRMPIPRGLYVSSALPFGAWLFVIGILIGAFVQVYIIVPRRCESIC